MDCAVVHPCGEHVLFGASIPSEGCDSTLQVRRGLHAVHMFGRLAVPDVNVPSYDMGISILICAGEEAEQTHCGTKNKMVIFPAEYAWKRSKGHFLPSLLFNSIVVPQNEIKTGSFLVISNMPKLTWCLKRTALVLDRQLIMGGWKRATYLIGIAHK